MKAIGVIPYVNGIGTVPDLFMIISFHRLFRELPSPITDISKRLRSGTLRPAAMALGAGKDIEQIIIGG